MGRTVSGHAHGETLLEAAVLTAVAVHAHDETVFVLHAHLVVDVLLDAATEEALGNDVKDRVSGVTRPELYMESSHWSWVDQWVRQGDHTASIRGLIPNQAAHSYVYTKGYCKNTWGFGNYFCVMPCHF